MPTDNPGGPLPADSPRPEATPSRARPHRRWLLWGVALGITAAMWAGVATFAHEDRQSAIRETWQSTGNLSRVLAEQVERSLAAADRLVRFVRYVQENEPGADPIGRARDLGLISEANAQVAVVDRNGSMIRALIPPPPDLASLDGRDYFRALRDAPDDMLFISKPTTGRVTGRWSVNLVRRLRDANGQFAGVVLTSLDPFWFSRFFAEINLGEEGSAQIFDLSGVILARNKLTDEMLRADQKVTRLAALARSPEGSGNIELVSPFDGLEKYLSVRKVPSYPVAVSVGFSRNEVMAPVERRHTALLLSAGLLSIALLTGAGLLDSSLARRRRLSAERDLDREQLRVAKVRMTDVLEGMADALIVIDKDGCFEICNEAYREMFAPVAHLLRPGVPLSQIQIAVRSKGMIVHQDEGVHEWLRDNNNPLKTFRVQTKLSDGRWLLCSNTKTSDGSQISLRSDITLMKQHEEELTRAHDRLMQQAEELNQLLRAIEQAKSEAEKAYEARGQFVAHLSHELRGPLTSVIGYAELMEAEAAGPIPAEYKSWATRIVASGRHQIELINDVLDLARAEGGHILLSEAWISARELADWALQQVAPMAGDAGVKLHGDVADDISLHVDLRRFRQVFLNLLTNAIKYAQDGDVYLRIRRNDDGGATIELTDTGIGIDAKDLPNVMKMFQQVANEQNTSKVGSGVGLPLTAGLVQAHGATFELLSDGKGRGTTARIVLPPARVRMREDVAAE